MNKQQFLAALLATATSAFAQSDPAAQHDHTLELPGIVVTAPRLPGNGTPLAEYPGNVSIITRTEIEESPAYNLPALLRQEAGVMAYDSIGGGSQTAALSLRGFGEKAGTLILIDGVRMNDAGDGFFLWGSVPLENIDRVEIIRGGASMVYGEGAAAGVINIVTRKAAQKPWSLGTRLEAGSFGYYSGHLDISVRTNNFSYRFNADRTEWSGYRDGANFRSWNLGGQIGTETAAGEFTLGYIFHQQYSEDPSPITPAEFAANPRQVGTTQFAFENDVHRVNLAWQHDLESGWEFDARLHAQSYETFSTGFGPTKTEQPSLGGVLQLRKKSEIAGRDNALTVGTEGIRQEFTQSTAFGKTIHDSTTISGFIEDSLQILEKTRLSAGARFDSRDTDMNIVPAFSGSKSNDEWSYKLSLNRELPWQAQAWIGWSDTYRLPSANDVVSGDPTFASNPTLVPVRSRTLELGLRSDESKPVSASVTWFTSQVKNDIFYNPTTFANANGDVLRQGIEASLRARPAKWISLYQNITYNDVTFDGGANDGRNLVLVPEFQLGTGISLHPGKGLTLSLENTYVGRQVRINDVANALERNAYNVLSVRLAYRHGAWETYASVNNLLDRLYEQLPASPNFFGDKHNPAPGIGARIGLRAEF